MAVDEAPDEGATPEAEEEAPPENTGEEEPGTTPDEPAEGETPEAAGEDPPGEEPEEDPEGDKPEEETPLHKALKAERQSVKDLKAANADLVKTNAELLERVEAMEAAELERKTNDLVKERGLSKDQGKALANLATFEERQAIASVMYPPPRMHIPNVGRGHKPSYFESEIMAANLDPVAIRQIMKEIGKTYESQARYDDMDEEDQVKYVIRKARARGLHLAGKKTSPAY